MAEALAPQIVGLKPVAKPVSLIPVGLKEAALDSPTFRGTVVHFSDQIDIVEKWLDGYVKAAGRLSNEVSSIENIINSYLSWASPPAQVSEAILDFDYTALALKRYNEGAKEFWSSTLKWMKKVESTVIDPIKAFLHGELAAVKNLRRVLDMCQRNFDTQIARYVSQSKTKEPSALREDAFQLHEARKAYLKASMDFCTAAPQARLALDKLLIKIFSDRWKDMKNTRDALASNVAKWSTDLDRIRGWSKEMENSERIFKRELFEARQTIEESASSHNKPSRDLDDYAKSTVAYLGQAPDVRSTVQKGVEERSEKQGWLFQRTIQGKPARHVWVRRWFYVKHGIFGWLSNNPRTGAVEESDKIGVLLCGIRPSFQDERRFCFEVKTKDASIELQAETQSELMDWIATFEVAKRKALENPASTEAIAAGSKSIDAAFAISPPIAPEFAAKNPEVREDETPPERSNTLGLEPPTASLGPRASTDLAGRRSMVEGGESSRERLMQKLDLHRNKGNISPGPGAPSPVGGIASLISASHTVLPLGGAGHNITPSLSLSTDFKSILNNNPPASSLAPSTLVNPPAPTNLSKTAVVVCADKDLSLGLAATDGGMPGGIMANVWGSNNWGYLNRMERGEVRPPVDRRRSMSQPPSPNLPQDANDALVSGVTSSSGASTPLPHRKTMSVAPDLTKAEQNRLLGSQSNFPNYYPVSLKAQDAQFRTLFPEVRRDDKLVMVFRATWNPSDQQEFPGRVYVTASDVYFFSNHLGLVLISGVSFDSIQEITAAPGKDSDFVFLHLRPDISVDGASRITLRTYLDPLKLLQKRLTYLVRNADSPEPDGLEAIIKHLIKLEAAGDDDSPSMDSWEDVSLFTPVDGGRSNDAKGNVRIDGTLFPDPSRKAERDVTKFRLPSQPVNYTPQGMGEALIERTFNVTAKALFHVLAGDKSAIWQMLDGENGAQNLLQGPWLQLESQTHFHREFKFSVATQPGTAPVAVIDTQTIDVLNDHLCYVLTERRTPWSLPSARHFSVITKLILTHTAKAKCKLAVYAKVDWRRRPLVVRGLLERQARVDAKLLASSLVEILEGQVAMLGSGATNNSRKAMQIFGGIGTTKDVLQPTLSDLPRSSRERLRPHTLQSLLFAAGKQAAKNTVLAVVGAAIYLAQAAAKMISSHHILVLVLVFSTMANVWLTQKDAWGYWRDRSAQRFMRGIGVGSGDTTSLGHSIWLRDLETILPSNRRSESSSFEDGEGNHTASIARSNHTCSSAFSALLRQTDPHSPPLFAEPSDGSSLSMTHIDTSTVGRLQSLRNSVGVQRHDLLVALRVVDRVEKEAVNAEFESWAWQEIAQCRKVKGLLQTTGKWTRDDAVGEWLDGYCTSCYDALDR